MTTTATHTTAEQVLAALAAYDLRDEGSGKYRSNSPLRPGSNSHGFTLTIDGAEHGAFYDHVSGEQGSLYQLAEILGIEREHKPAPQSSKRRYDSLAEYCGADYVETFKAAGWSDVKSVHDIATRQERPALVYETRSGTRYRFVDGEKPPYAPAQKGQNACWYGLERAIKLANEEHPLVLVNGASSVVTAQAHGVPAIALEGSGESNIASHLRKGLLDELRQHYPTGSIDVALDCDEAGGRAAQKVVPILHEAGYEVAARDMGGTDGFDMRDFCRLHQDDSLGALAKCKLLALDAEAHAAPEQEQTYRWRLRSRDDLMQQSVPVDLLEGVFSTRSLVMLYSEFGAGKSVVAADMAMALAQQHNVLYVAAEAFYIYNPRVRGWELHHRLTTERLHWIDDAINLGNPAEVDRLIGIAQALNIAMVVVDTYSASTNAFGMNENDNGDSERAAHQLKRIRKETGATVLVVHHQGKAGNGSRGGTALPAACDTIYHLEARDDVLVFACEKARMSTKPDTRYFRIIEKTTDLVDDDGNTITAPVLLPAARVDMQKSPLSERDKDVLAELCGEILSKGARQVDVAEALGLSQRNLAKRSLEKLMKHGYVTMSENKLFCATAEGKAFHERQLQVTPGVTSGDSGDESYTLNWRVRPPKPKNVLQHPNAEVTASYSDVTPEVTGEKLQVTGVTPPFRGVTCVTETEVELVMTEEQANVQAEAEAPADHALPRPRSIPIRRRVESASESAKPEAAEPRLPEGPLGLPAGWKEAWTASKAYIQARHPDLGVHTDAYPRTSSGLQELLRDIEKLEAEHALARRE